MGKVHVIAFIKHYQTCRKKSDLLKHSFTINYIFLTAFGNMVCLKKFANRSVSYCNSKFLRVSNIKQFVHRKHANLGLITKLYITHHHLDICTMQSNL